MSSGQDIKPKLKAMSVSVLSEGMARRRRSIEFIKHNGSGFIVGPNVIVTAKHLVMEMEEHQVSIEHNGNKYRTKKIHMDPEQDIAVIMVEGTFPGPFLQLAKAQPKKGNLFTTYSTQFDVFNRGTYQNTRKNTFKTDTGYKAKLEHYEMTGMEDVREGFSGSPVLNQTGEIISMIIGGEENKGKMISAGAKIDHIAKALKDAYPVFGMRDPGISVPSPR